MPSHEEEIEIIKNGLGEKTEVVVFEYQDSKKEEFIEIMKDADALLTGFIKLGGEDLDRMKKLKIISINATGYNILNIGEANERKIAVSPVGEYCTIDVAEYTIAVMLALVKNIKGYVRNLENNYVWDYQLFKPNNRIKNLTLGIFGLGKIGSAVSMRAKALGMNIIAYDPYVSPTYFENLSVKYANTPEEIYENSDIITNHMNLNETNEKFFNYESFKKMKKNPYFINTGRGESVVDEDLLLALKKGLLKGVALDVFSDERPENQKNNP